ncbi:MAG: gluconate 2-dehydrogenase subunit 3 family protein [Deltaproteobacteria bacterium]|nr:gluconate 2-dehydrogenase subunit 3 family protein [Deltaproteobacteria bacterium]
MSGSDSDVVLSPHERATIEAAVACIVPSDEDPGAREAGVIDYIEGLLATDDDVDTDISPREKKEYANFLLGSMGGRTEEQQATLFKLNGLGSRHRQAYRDGVVELDRLAAELDPGKNFCGLDEAGQDRVLTALDERKDPFFALLLTHTMEGFYGHPRHGGNRDQVGWQMLEYPGPSFPHGNETPYGWYDENEPEDFPHAKKDRSS